MVAAIVRLMATARTGAERYLRDRRKDPEYERAYVAARQRIDLTAADLSGADLTGATLPEGWAQ